jgi:hypothetical protein
MERRFWIRVRGRVGERFGEVFGPVATETVGDHTEISGQLVDQANLDGILAYLRNLGVELISLETWDKRAPSGDQIGATPRPSAKEMMK